MNLLNLNPVKIKASILCSAVDDAIRKLKMHTELYCHFSFLHQMF